MASFALQVIRLAFSATAKVSPHAAGRAAFRVFSRTRSRRPKNAKEKNLLSQSDGWMRQAGRVRLAFAGGRAVAHHFSARPCRPFRGRVLVVHGWGSRAAYLAVLTSGLAAAGYEVVALDLPGHGHSPGRRLTMPMAVRAIDAAWRHFGGFDFFCGHSFGGAALACAAGGLIADVLAHAARRLVLIGSPSEMGWLFRDLGRTLQLTPAAQAALEDRVEAVAGIPIEAFDAASVIAHLRVPVLVIHARDDKEVPASHALRYAAAGANVTLQWADGFGHRRIVSAAPVIDRVSAFLAGEEDTAAA